MIETMQITTRYFASAQHVARAEQDMYEAELEMARRAFGLPRRFRPDDPDPVDTVTRETEYWVMLPDEALS